MLVRKLIIQNIKKLFHYGIIGSINTVVTYGLFLIISNYIDYRITIGISYTVGIFLSYFLNRKFVFKSKGSFWIFVVISIVMFFTNLTVTWVLVEKFNTTKEIAQLFAIGVVFIVGFVLNRRFSFMNIQHKY